MKIKSVFFIAAFALLIFACNKDDNDNFDAEAQAEIDNEALIEYLQTHYLNEEDGGLWTITNGETPLMGQVETQEITYNDIAYKLYYLVKNKGVGKSPTNIDSIYCTYTGMLLDSTVFDSKTTFSWNIGSSPATLNNLIPGWQYGFSNFKGGTVVINDDESFDYEDFGQGVLFIPSGLAYQNTASGIIEKNSPLIFEISLKDVRLRDTDLDGVLSNLEDRNGDGNVYNDDTDEDGIPDYADTDDDGDGILTVDESKTDDDDNDGIPNYLDPDN